MDVRRSIHSVHAKTLNTQGPHSEFLVKEVFVAGEYTMVYSHIDRIIVGGIMPVAKTVSASGEVGKRLGATYFLERRELGVINTGGPDTTTVGDQCYEVGHRDTLCVGRGVKGVTSASIDAMKLAEFYYNYVPAHTTYPAKKVMSIGVAPVTLDDSLTSNRHAVNKYFVPDVLETCQLSVGLTELAPGNLWNTMPCHTHEHRMGIYLCFNMEEDTCIFHMMDQPQKTCHIVVHDERAAISPSWFIHPGVDTKAYIFIWGMVSENQVSDGMGHVAVKNPRQLWATTVLATTGIIEN